MIFLELFENDGRNDQFNLVGEGMLDNPGQEDSPVAQAIIRRILLRRTDLLAKHGPEKVGQAVDEVADFVGDADEIGSSDVSGWIRQVEQILDIMDKQGVAEGLDQPREAGKAIQSLKNLAVMKSALTMQQLSQAGRESIVTNAINAAKTLEQSYMANKQQGNAIFVRALRDEIDNFRRGAPINASFPESDNVSELGDLLQGKLGKVDFQQGVSEGAVKELSDDLKTMSDQEFQSRYNMTKDQARANLKRKDENIRGFRGVGGARHRENDENDKIDAMLRQQAQQRKDYEQTGKFWIKQKDTQQHISDEFIGKAAANAAALDMLKQRPELKGNIVITAYGPGESQGVAEASYQGKGNHRPGWMLKADSELAKKVKANKDNHKTKVRAMGNPAAGKSVEQGVAEAEKNPHTSALGKALYRDLSKEKKASPQQVQRNKERWAQRQAEREQGVAEGSDQTNVNKQISKFEELALAANRAGDDEKCKLYQKKIQALKQKMSQSVAEGNETPDSELERLKLRQNAEHGRASLQRQTATQARIRELEKQIKDKKQEVAEVSDELRNRYVTRASDDYSNANFAARASKDHPGLEQYSDEQEKRAKKRAAGLNRALSDKRLGRTNETEGDMPSQRNTDFRHRVAISYTDPNSSAVSQRKELQQKIILVPATNKDGTTLYQGEAEELARKWAKRHGLRVKEINYVEFVKIKPKQPAVDEGYRVVPGIDRERYTERPGLEGPFHTKSGKVVYYDKQEGKYYDPDSDFYISHDDYQAMNEAAESMPAVDKFGVPVGSKYYTPAKQTVNELSNEKLAQYKTAAAADASRADKAGDFKRGDKRFSGINKATMKQFSNDAKK